MADETAYDQLIDAFEESSTLRSIGSLLDWDQQTNMPPKGAEARGDQVALVQGLVHDRLASDEMADLLARAADEVGEDGDDRRQANVREIGRVVERSQKIPRDLVEEIARTTTVAQSKWVEARENDDFDAFAPFLETIVGLNRRVIEALEPEGDPYDALLDHYEPGQTTEVVAEVLDALRAELVPLVQEIAEAGPVAGFPEGTYPVDAQKDLCRETLSAIGFDFDAGRLDESAHPFCSGFHPNDVRLTTRYDDADPRGAFFGVIHEGGHGLYEQGLPAEHAGTPLGSAASTGIHESQSRLWENQIARSRPFWEAWLPRLKEAFPGALEGVDLDTIHPAVNRAGPSLIRVTADEVTYNLHIILRFEIERELIGGDLDPADLPGRWNDGMEELLGIRPEDDADGCLQDVHWAAGLFGYFPTYTLGNLYAAQIMEAADEAIPDLDDLVAEGEFTPLRGWLREEVHAHGHRWPADDLCERVTGSGLDHEPFCAYLREKYGRIYDLG